GLHRCSPSSSSFRQTRRRTALGMDGTSRDLHAVADKRVPAAVATRLKTFYAICLIVLRKCRPGHKGGVETRTDYSFQVRRHAPGLAPTIWENMRVKWL